MKLIEKMGICFDNIFKYRYLIGIIFFCILVIGGIHGSSMGFYNDTVQPSIREEKFEPMYGRYKAIRSDEFLGTTPIWFSQNLYNSDFDTTNSALMAKDTSVVLFPALPTKTTTVLAFPQFWGSFFLPLNQAYSFYWNLPIFLTFFGVLELMMILTKKNKYFSLLGAVLIGISPTFFWWNSFFIMGSGSIATICFYNLIVSETSKKRLLSAAGLGWAGSCYILTLYPAWQMPYGYLFLGLFIWILIENKEKLQLKKFAYLLVSIGIIGIIVIPGLIMSMDTIEVMQNTVYPGEREVIGGYGWKLNFNYFISWLFGRYELPNSSEATQFISFYPIPILMGIYFCIKNHILKKKDTLLTILVVVSIPMTIWNYVPMKLLSKVTLMSMSMPERSQLVVNVICIIILMKILAEYSSDKKRPIWFVGVSAVLSVIYVAGGICVIRQEFPDYMTVKKTVFVTGVFIVLAFLLFLRQKYANYLLGTALLGMSCVVLITVAPIMRGNAVLTEKPLAKEIQKISDAEPDAVWLGVESSIVLQNYALANGVRVLNSINYAPNFEFWETIDNNNEYEEIYNRFSHIIINLTEEETTMSLLQPDLIQVEMNVDELKELSVDYIVSFSGELEKYSNSEVSLERIYSEDNTSIYKVN